MKNQKKSRNDFRNRKNNQYIEKWYDLEYDKELICQSIAKQYHILPSEQGELAYSDWIRLVAGLMDDTPLGRVVSIRQENDKDIIKSFGSYEKRIRAEWTSFRDTQISKSYTTKDKQDIAAYFEKLFSNMLG